MLKFVGVIGFLALWKVKLDPISMVTMIMAIGFSIEYCAHITYGFVSNPNNLMPTERCIEAMEKLAWPGKSSFCILKVWPISTNG